MTIECAICGKTSDTGEGWIRIQVSSMPVLELEPMSLGGDANKVSIVYCEPQHVHAWFTRAGLPEPEPIP